MILKTEVDTIKLEPTYGSTHGIQVENQTQTKEQVKLRHHLSLILETEVSTIKLESNCGSTYGITKGRSLLPKIKVIGLDVHTVLVRASYLHSK